MIYFTSDLHFGHQNILEYTDRPFPTIDAHDEAIIERYNSKVNQGDIVYFLGDIFFCSQGVAKDYLSRMRGTKVLIKGNHDKNKDNFYYDAGFDVVLEQAQIRLSQKKIVHLSHYPFRAPWYKRLYWHITNPKHRNYKSRKYKNVIPDGKYLLHGHVHTNVKINGKMIHVGLDAWDCYPVSATEITQLIDKVENENKTKP